MSSKTPEQLEAEADELFRKANAQPEVPPAKADTDEPGDGDGAADATPPNEQPEGTPPATDTASPGELTVETATERMKNAQARMTKALQEAADLRKEQAALRAASAQLQNEIDELKARTPATPAGGTPPETDTDALGDSPELKDLMAEYPSIVPPLVGLIAAQKKELKDLRAAVDKTSRRAERDDAQAEESAKTAARKSHDDAILKVHPDVFDISGSDDFLGWVERQTSMIKQAVQTGTAEDVIAVLDKYKVETGIDEREAEAEQGSTPRTPRVRQRHPNKGRAVRFTREQIRNMPMEEFNRREKEIDEATAAGLIS